MFNIVHLPHIQQLRSIILIKDKMTQQEYSKEPLYYIATYDKATQTQSAKKYIPEATHFLCSYKRKERDDCDSDASLSSSSEESFATDEELEIQAASLQCTSETKSSENMTAHATCVKINSDCMKNEMLFALRIHDIKQSDDVAQVLDAMQEFIHKARKDLADKKDPFRSADVSILMRQHIHVRKYICFDNHKDEKEIQMNVRLQPDGTIDYAHTTQDNHACNRLLLCIEDCITHTWSGKIQQIDYKHLYDSLDALFAIVYVNTNIQEAVQTREHARIELYRIFRNMHFPQVAHAGAIRCYQDTEDINMPLAFVRYSLEDGDTSIRISELAHMSVLMDIHKCFVLFEDVFAYHLAGALLDDIITLWQTREELMKKTDLPDLLAYGIVPVIQDQLPCDYAKYFTIPLYMQHHELCSFNSAEYLLRIMSVGTCEMCTWGYAMACLFDAMKESLPGPKIDLLVEAERLITCIDQRFEEFVNIPQKHTLRVCNNILQHNLRELSGGVMPLFCMAICSVMSLSYALRRISIAYDDKTTLNTDNLIRISEKDYDLLSSQLCKDNLTLAPTV